MSAGGERQTETIPEWKREEVAELADFLGRYESVGVVDITGIPSRQLQDMRRDLHGTAELRVSRNTLLSRALDEGDAGLADLVDHVSGQVGLIGTNDNPFGLYRQLEASKTSAPINAGEVAPNDVVIPEGDTGIDPGPFVGELQSVGANARIDAGSIKVVEDSQVLSAGDEVSGDLANVLGELGIEPKEVGLDLRAVFADGILFEPEDLELDVGAYRSDVAAGASRARNLSINAAVPTAATVPALLGKASGEARSLGLAGAIPEPGVIEALLGRADGQVRALAGLIDDEEALPAELQDVDAEPAEVEQTDDQPSDAEPDDEPADETGTDDADTEDDEEDDDDGAGALGDMFGD